MAKNKRAGKPNSWRRRQLVASCDRVQIERGALLTAPVGSRMIGFIQAAAPECIGFAIEAQAVITPGSDIAAQGSPARLPTISIDAYDGGPMMVGGYYRPVVVECSGVTGGTVPLLRNHDADRIVGHGTVSVDGGKIRVAGTLSGAAEETEEITTLAANGFPWQASIGLQPTRLENVEAGAKVVVNGAELSGPFVLVRAGRLKEVSVLAVGASGETSAKVAAQGVNAMGFEAWAKAKGFDLSQMTVEATANLRELYVASGWGGNGGGNAGGQAGGNGQGNGQNSGQGSGTVNAGGGQMPEAIIAARKAKEARQLAYARIINAAMDRGMASEEAELLVAAANAADMSETQFELEVMRAERDSSGAAYGFAKRPRSKETPQDVLECALAQTANETEYEHMNADGTKKTIQLYSDEIQQRARDAYPRGLTLMELVVKAARRAGFNADTYRVSKAMLQAAFTPIMARGASTYDLSGILSNVANKSIVAGFDAVENSWREVSAISTVTDFKELTHYALTGDFIYEQVGNGGELRNATMGEQSYGNKAETYGKIFAITRQDFINDDLSAFNRVRTLLGRGAALKLNLVFWTEFLDAVTTFFTSGRGNYMEGASTALDIDALTAAELLFLNQTDPDGNPLGLDAAILLVPNALATLATRLTRDTELRVDGASSKTTYTTANPHAGKWRPVRSSYLNNANVANGSATHWFLTASPSDMPLIETVFLNGQQRPMVEAADADFDILGVQMRGFHDFGVRKQEYRAGVRSKGAA